MSEKKSRLDKLFEGINNKGNITPVVYKLLVESTHRQERAIYILSSTLCFAIVVIFLISYLWATEQKQFLAYEFNSSSNAIYRIFKADENLTRDAASVLFLLRSYVVARETINHLDEKERYLGQVAHMSSSEVFETFSQSGRSGGLSQLIMDKSFTRTININSSVFIGKIEDRNVLIDFDTIDTKDGEIRKLSWRASINFNFSEEFKKIDDMIFNPLGIYITSYTLSSYGVKK